MLLLRNLLKKKTNLISKGNCGFHQIKCLILIFVLIRCSQFFFIGFAIGGPGLRKWYGVLEKTFNSPNRAANTFKKVALDQVLFAPIFLGSVIKIISFIRTCTDLYFLAHWIN